MTQRQTSAAKRASRLLAMLCLPLFVGVAQPPAKNQQVVRATNGSSVWMGATSRSGMGPNALAVPNPSTKIYSFLRFFADGKVVGTEFATVATLADVENWDFFKASFAALSECVRTLHDVSLFFGEYSINGSSIKFSLSYPNGPVDYDGVIQGASLELNFVSRSNNNAGKEHYELLVPEPVKK